MANRSVNRRCAGPVLKTVSTATCGDRDLSAPPVQGRLTGQGSAPAGNRAVRLKRMGIVRSVFRHYGRSTRQEPGARSKRDGWATIGDQDLGLPPALARPPMSRLTPSRGEGRHQLTRSGAPVARLAHTQEVGRSIRSSATIMGRYARGQSSGAVNAVPSGFGGSNPSPAHHAAIAQWQSFCSPGRRRRIVTDWPLQFAL